MPNFRKRQCLSFTACFLLTGCVGSERVTVIKSINGYGDYLEKDRLLIERLCVRDYPNAILQETFKDRYSTKPVRLVSGPPIAYNVSVVIDERRTVEERYSVELPVLTFVDGIAMDDGETRPIVKTRKVLKGRIRNVYAECRAIEYHF